MGLLGEIELFLGWDEDCGGFSITGSMFLRWSGIKCRGRSGPENKMRSKSSKFGSHTNTHHHIAKGGKFSSRYKLSTSSTVDLVL